MRSEEERHTARKMPKPANIAFAGGNGCRSHQGRYTDKCFSTYYYSNCLVKGGADRRQAQDFNQRIEHFHKPSIMFPEFTKALCLF